MERESSVILPSNGGKMSGQERLFIVESNIQAIIRDNNQRELEMREALSQVRQEIDDLKLVINTHTRQIHALLNGVLYMAERLARWKQEEECKKQLEK